VDGKGPDQGVDQDVQILPQVISRFHDVAAMAVDERRQVGRLQLVARKHIGALLEVSEPQIMGMLAAPSLSDFLLENSQFEACSAGGLQVPVKGGAAARWPSTSLAGTG